MPDSVEVKPFKMVCPICWSGQFSISEPGVADQPREWGPEVLGVADCRGCQKVFLVKLPQELAIHIFNHIDGLLDPFRIISAREALGLP